MPNIFSSVEVAEAVCGCLQEARAEVRNSTQSRDYLHVCENHMWQRKGWETIRSLRRTNSFAALHKVAEEAGSSSGPWPMFSASLAFCLALAAFIVMVRKPRLSSHLSFLMVHRGILCLSFCLHHWGASWEAHCPWTSFLGTLDMPFLAVFVAAVVRWDLTFSLISRSWHGIDRQAALLLMCITNVTVSAQHGPGTCCARQWTHQNEDLFTVFFLPFCSSCFKWNHDRDLRVTSLSTFSILKILSCHSARKKLDKG